MYYRIWDRKKKEYVNLEETDLLIRDDGLVYEQSFSVDRWYIEPRPHMKLERFLEIYDKEQTPVFENDIVCDGYELGVVKFGRSKDMTINCGEYPVDFCGVYLDIEDTNNENRCDYDKWLVIGTTNERPELLESNWNRSRSWERKKDMEVVTEDGQIHHVFWSGEWRCSTSGYGIMIGKVIMWRYH